MKYSPVGQIYCKDTLHVLLASIEHSTLPVYATTCNLPAMKELGLADLFQHHINVQ